MTPPAVTVMVNGRIVSGPSSEARLVNGRIVAPVAPYVDAVASADAPAGDGSLRVSAGDRTIFVRTDAFGRVALGAVARALGERVDFDPVTRTLAIETATSALVPFRPATGGATPPGAAALAPTTDLAGAPTPKPSVDGIPQPRRTPLEAGRTDDGP